MSECTHNGCCRDRTGHCGACRNHRQFALTADEQAFMLQLGQTPFLPIAQFLLRSSKSGHLESVALAPVYLNDKNDSPETVKSAAVTLRRLEQYGLISLDYDVPLRNCGESVFRESSAYEWFRDAVAEGSANPAFLFDVPALAVGSLALTASGQKYLDEA